MKAQLDRIEKQLELLMHVHQSKAEEWNKHTLSNDSFSLISKMYNKVESLSRIIENNSKLLHELLNQGMLGKDKNKIFELKENIKHTNELLLQVQSENRELKLELNKINKVFNYKHQKVSKQDEIDNILNQHKMRMIFKSKQVKKGA